MCTEILQKYLLNCLRSDVIDNCLKSYLFFLSACTTSRCRFNPSGILSPAGPTKNVSRSRTPPPISDRLSVLQLPELEPVAVLDARTPDVGTRRSRVRHFRFRIDVGSQRIVFRRKIEFVSRGSE